MLLVPLCGSGCAHTITSCLAEATLIATPQGDQAVENLKVGDQVWTYSSRGELEVGTITHVHAAVANLTLELVTENGKMVRATPSHPIRTESALLGVSHQWVNAGKLRVGQRIVTRDGLTTVIDIRSIREEANVYDLTVEPNNNFYAAGILVHNKMVVRPPKPEEIAGTWISLPEYYDWMYRIDLNADGSGAAARTSLWPQHGEVEPVTLRSWSLNEFTLTIYLETTGIGADEVELSGYVTQFQKSLRLQGVGARWVYSDAFIFRRPDQITDMIRKLEQAMDTSPRQGGSS